MGPLAPAEACPRCRQAVSQGIHDQHFGTRLGITVAPFAGMALLGYGMYWAARSRHRKTEGRP
jgi:hypothetical protein